MNKVQAFQTLDRSIVLAIKTDITLKLLEIKLQKPQNLKCQTLQNAKLNLLVKIFQTLKNLNI